MDKIKVILEILLWFSGDAALLFEHFDLAVELHRMCITVNSICFPAYHLSCPHLILFLKLELRSPIPICDVDPSPDTLFQHTIPMTVVSYVWIDTSDAWPFVTLCVVSHLAIDTSDAWHAVTLCVSFLYVRTDDTAAWSARRAFC